MSNSLAEFRERVDKLIEQHGEDATCAGWIYTQEDVFTINKYGDEEYVHDTDPALCSDILCDVADDDYIYQVIQDKVDDAMNQRLPDRCKNVGGVIVY